MEVRLHVPFRQILEWMRRLSSSQKAELIKELEQEESGQELHSEDFLTLLSKGPLYDEASINKILENRNSIELWRKKK